MSSPSLSGAELRRAFLESFSRHGHEVVRSASLVPSDPTLMFTNAGMVPFKDVFTGKEQRPYRRAASCQTCLRVSGKHNDLEEVGRTPRHHTFFEMLGNFSFGDYFKEEAIRLAWSLLTEEWKLDKDRLWVTVHHTDDEAHELWTRMVGVPEARVHRLGDKDNFWSMGPVGPCGPCTEIHYDLGGTMGAADPLGPAGGTDRYMEIWNLVFMQYEQHPDGSRTDLAKPCVDTGMGLERLASVVQGKTSNYDSDLLHDLIEDAAEIAGIRPGGDPEADVALRVLADHARATAFLVAEGQIPANEGRGYVCRRIARRAIRFGVKLGLGDEPFFHRLTDQVVSRFGEAYPFLLEKRSFVDRVLKGEEERFAETRDKGLALLSEELDRKPARIPGDVVFKLHDTFGFPPDLTRLIAEERGIGIDEAGYTALMEGQREAGRAAWKGSGDESAEEVYRRLASDDVSARFTGYTSLTGSSTVVALVQGGKRVDTLAAGQDGEVLVEVTPFYAESGGQTGDRGRLTGPGTFDVADTQSPVPGVIVHKGRLVDGGLKVGDVVELAVDRDARDGARRNHTATHLLHAALREVLGDHIAQKGSLVAPDRLRFDFAHFAAVTPEELARIEELVYRAILDNHEVSTTERSLDEARAAGAMAFFGEKYGERVRVVQVADVSMELCGGTHVARTGDIGFFRILSEGSVSSSVRRVEAQTGLGALRHVRALASTVDEAAGLLGTGGAGLVEALERLQAEQKALRKELKDFKTAQALTQADDLVATAREIGGMRVIAAATEGDREALKAQADKLRDKLGSGIVVLGAASEGEVLLVAAVTKDLAGSKAHAGKLVSAIAALVGGRGGGRPDFAQAGGSDAAALPAALEQVYTIVGAA